jgi:AraC family transcriptional regulator, ethanolamine operon transcriptional activator
MQIAEELRSRISQAKVTVRKATQADQHSANFTGWLNEFTQLTPGAFEGLAREIWLGPIQLFHNSVNRATRYRGCAWDRSRVLLSFLPVYGPFYLGQRQIPSGTLLSYRWDDADRFTLTTGFESVGICIDEQVLQQYSSTVWETHRLPSRRVFHPASSSHASCRNFQVQLLTIINELCACPEILERPAARREIVDDLLEAVVSVIAESAEGIHERPPPAVRAYIVYRAQEFIEEHLAASVSLTELCGALKISRRALEYAFRDVVGISPRRYIMALRLRRARQEILDHDTLPCIYEVAERWGFNHLGRFGGVYKDFFGELPSQTLRRGC